MGCRPNSVELRHPLVKALYNIIDGEGFKQMELAEAAGIAPRCLTSWRIGRKPNLFLFEAVANAAGYDLKLVKRGPPPVDPIIVELQQLFENYGKAWEEARRWGGPTIEPQHPIGEHQASYYARALSRLMQGPSE